METENAIIDILNLDEIGISPDSIIKIIKRRYNINDTIISQIINKYMLGNC